MRVAINANPLTDRRLRGWTRYTVNLLSAISEHGVRPLLYARSPLNPDHLDRLPAGSFDVAIAPAMSYVQWEQWWIPRRCRADRVDLFHCPLNFGVPVVCPVPRVLTLHDAIGWVDASTRPSWRERWTKGAVASSVYHLAARMSAERIITESEHARGDLVSRLGISSDRVSVIPGAADPTFLEPVAESNEQSMRARWGLTRPYVFYVGGWEDRKNIPFLLQGYAASGLTDVDLVLAGGRDDQRAILDRLAADLGIVDRLRLLDFIPDAELPAMYSAALGFAYPSRYEGFGLQLLEAMAVGCPVLAARATCLPEVLGEGGETFALGDPGELGGLLKRLASDSTYRADLALRARRRSADFAWDRTAAETVAVYRAALAG